ncbi:DUF1837 domain-containing protein [Endozoicomonas sp. SM1973]|uniref:DUF1837 domain-containing protein n=1 Tax=Spartinivicinus marinus TaxID=2994442 RepID=A0A853I5Y4_9GAMM|nr:DUF1837 domain-containing protein [Spartinivicinus marinus]MCX4027211.1 DUF1837 domain-containing protein [Spartinivicinus marinus]NYZ66068.1 DUF1837 domain-containing protein [Spartinivicinus marinus]
MENGPFGSRSIIEKKITEDTLRSFLVGFDLNDQGESQYRWSKLVQKITNVIHEFSFGFHEGTTTHNTQTLEKLVEAANSIYKIDSFQKVRDIYSKNDHISDELDDKYLRRGEFGELILHLILRDHLNTIPLLSKIYFKDSLGHTVHGFDCVHVEPESKTMWLGESKLYIDPKRGLSELIRDIEEHFKTNYLDSEFSLIAKKIKHFNNIPGSDHWKKLLSNTTKLKDKLDEIYIPLLCTYSCDLFEKYDDENKEEFVNEYEDKIRKLKKYFDDRNNHPLRSRLKIIVMLLPVKCKKELVKRLHKKLSLLQSVGDE